MRFRLVPVLLVALSPATALASASVECATTDGSNILLIGNMGRVEGAALDAAILTVGERTWSTRDRPAHIRVVRYRETRAAIGLDLAGPGTDRLQLRVRINPEGASTGALAFRGRTHPVTCEFG
jgi:hypothetical protein